MSGGADDYMHLFRDLSGGALLSSLPVHVRVRKRCILDAVYADTYKKHSFFSREKRITGE
jgi:hypothetical protein